MSELKIEYVLMLTIVVFILYHFMDRCSYGDGFRVGAQAPLHRPRRRALVKSFWDNLLF